MKAQLLHRSEIQQLSGSLVLALEELVSGNNVQPLEIGDAKIRSGTGSPEGRLLGTPGDLYLRTDGTAGLVVYTKATGKRTTTGWVPNGAARGTWTPIDSSGAGLALTQGTASVYTAIPLTTGSLVTACTYLTYPATGSGAAAVIGGLPVLCGTTPGAASIGYTNCALNLIMQVVPSTTTINLYTTAGVQVTNAQMTAKLLLLTATYFTA